MVGDESPLTVTFGSFMLRRLTFEARIMSSHDELSRVSRVLTHVLAVFTTSQSFQFEGKYRLID